MPSETFYTTNLPSGLRIAQVAGLTLSGFLAGTTFAASAATPALLKAPAPLLAKQWKTMFDANKLIAPVACLFSAGVFGYIGYREDKWTLPATLYTASASLLLSLVPYTYLLGEPINQKLEKKAQSLASVAITDAQAESGVSKEETTHALVDKWATINLGRAVISAASTAIAIWAAVDRTEVVPATARLAAGANRLG
ncbi:hypothetical protein AC578_5368 [Pseudocercospora eumusae]|uniref:DUF1772 domain-containing protein n=1 Tax=Pseudocercospora eumusae TaxID=321146 RepID=A0A139HJY6_9PEZI|nr:hypothetical protein AC578_5368 [Pseudocercospora eumusae]